jgi:hypothetical protein
VRPGDRIVRVGDEEPDVAQGQGVVGQIVGKLARPFVIELERRAGSARQAAATGQAAASSGSAACDDADVPASFDAAAKALLMLAMRYPASAVPLAQVAFAWAVPPLRAGGEVAVVRALRTWTEKTSSAADSALFSSMGLWVSPPARFLLPVLAPMFTYLVIRDTDTESAHYFPLKWFGMLAAALGSTAAAALLHTGRRESARWAWAAGFVMTAVCNAANAALTGCTCGWGPYADASSLGAYTDSTYDYVWEGVVMASMFLTMAGLATHPHRTFGIMFVAVPLLQVLLAVKVATVDRLRHAFVIDLMAILAAGLTGFGVYLWTGRAHALVEARRLAAADAVRYVRLWERLLATEGFRETLLSLENAWREVQNGALRMPKRQIGAPTLHALLTQADELNDLLQAKLYDVCAAHGGEHHACGIKAETRALQKVFRSYKGDWRRLGDLCRSSLVFDDIASLEACLRAIGADTELQVVHAGDVKMRLREGFDAEALSGGYRDIQLCVRLNTAEARVRGVHEHLCEVQLHFAPIIALKSGGGHKTYVLRRNLSGQ